MPRIRTSGLFKCRAFSLTHLRCAAMHALCQRTRKQWAGRLCSSIVVRNPYGSTKQQECTGSLDRK
eukprot:7385181-Prymnesium_polylepis.2